MPRLCPKLCPRELTVSNPGQLEPKWKNAGEKACPQTEKMQAQTGPHPRLRCRLGKDIEQPRQQESAYGPIDNPIAGSHQYINECS